jgi:hypothetical protein
MSVKLREARDEDLRAERVDADHEEVEDLITKMMKTAADGYWHDATLAMDLDGTRHPLKEQPPDKSRSKIPSEYVYRCRHRQNNSLL